MTLQFTLFSDKGYKPMSTLLEVPSVQDYNAFPKVYKDKAIQKICAKRYMGAHDLKKYGYTQIKVRKYEEKA